MARPLKTGVDYFPFDVDFFYDKKIKILKARYGSDGIIVYLYILTEIYKDKGYYTDIDDDFSYIIADDLAMDSQKIGQIINFLFSRSLLDSTLAKSDKVLTSHGIQLRFQEAVKSRAAKTAIEVNPKFWILSESETKPYIKCSLFSNYSQNNEGYSQNNEGYSLEKVHKEKKKKEKENKYKINDFSVSKKTKFSNFEERTNNEDLQRRILEKRLNDDTF